MHSSMEGIRSRCVVVVALCLVAAATVARAHIGEFDDHWRQRREEARVGALEAYESDPEEVTSHINHYVHL